MQFIARTRELARRSTRIRLHLPVRVTSIDPSIQFSESCYTLVVNVQGCGVRMLRPLQPGLTVVVDELPTGATVQGRVANCVPLGDEGKYWLVGIAFDHPENVWGVHPAPPDWGIVTKAAAAAAAAGSGNPTKHAEWPYSMFSNKGEAHPGRK